MTGATLDFRNINRGTSVNRTNATLKRRDRSEHDWYVEPESAVDALLDAERFRGTIYDPACGCGNIPRRCEARGLSAIGSDIADRGYGETGVDFLTAPPLLAAVPNIITNPPFNLAREFIDRALAIADHKVAALVRLAFLEGQARKPWFASTPLSRVLVFSGRISMPPGGRGIVAKGGAVAFCWLVWDRDHRGAPTVGWL